MLAAGAYNEPVTFPRSSGILLHPTSLPGRFGIGDLGPEAYRLVDFLAAAGQRMWEVLPLRPTGYGDSARVIRFKMPLLRAAYERFKTSWKDRREYGDFGDFRAMSDRWLGDYTLFMALKAAHGGEAVWSRWEPEIASRRPAALKEWRARLAEEIEALEFAQYMFFRQWRSLHNYARERGIRMMGDLPIYVAHDSADVWANPDLFQLDAAGDPAVMSGVPPDYFSATGQLWGNPIYRWDRMAQTGFRWWKPVC